MKPCRTTRRRSGAIPGLAAALVLCAGAASGDAPPPAQAPPPESRPAARGPSGATPIQTPMIETTTSELVLIEVYARDKDGHPVRDLAPGDLVLKIDWRPTAQPITSLEWIEPPAAPGGGATPPPEGASRPAPPAGAPGGPAPGEAALVNPSFSRRDWPRRFLLFFDDSTSSFTNMTSARRAALEYISRPGRLTDQFAIAVYDERQKLEILHDFTSDRTALARTLETSLQNTRRESDYGKERDERIAELDRLRAEQRQAMDMAAATVLEHEAVSKGTSYASDDSSRMGRVLNLTRTLVDALAPWPGYKAIVFVGDGIPENPAPDYNVSDPRLALTSEISALAQAAGGSNVTLHSVQTTGLTAGGTGQVAASLRRSNVLSTLALDTGGVARSTNDLAGAFADVEASSDGYYLLAYTPQGPPDGRYHTVDIRTKRKDLTLRYRRGFTRFTPSEARSRAVEAAYVAPELHRDLGLDLVAVTGPVTGKDRVVDLVVYVPPRMVLFLPEPGGAAARLEVGLVAIDTTGRETLKVARRVRVAVDTARATSGGPLALDFFSRVHLPSGACTVTAVIADAQSGTIGSARLSLAGSGEGPPGILGLSLYAVEEPSLWLEIASEDATGAGGEVDLQHSVGPALRSRFAPWEKVACGFRMAEGRQDAASRELHLEVLRGEEVVRRRPLTPDEGGGVPSTREPGGTRRAEVPVAGLADGEYVLCVREERDTHPAEMGRVSFRIAPRGAH